MSGRLKLIDLCAATLAAISTAHANGFSHTARIGIAGAAVLAVLTFAIVEFSTFTVEDGLRETFKGGAQRMLANLTYWAIRATMIANGALHSCSITGVTPPAQLRFWSHWSFAFHLAVGLVLIPLIRNADPVTGHRILTLKAETAHADLVTTRKRRLSATRSCWPLPACVASLMRWRWPGRYSGRRTDLRRSVPPKLTGSDESGQRDG